MRWSRRLIDSLHKELVNSLLIFPDELLGDFRARLEGERARYAYETHGLRNGHVIKVSVLGGGRGEGRVFESSPDIVTLELRVDRSCLPTVPLSLVVGVCRPQTIKKVIQSAVMFGAESLHFVRSELGEKSYLQSRSLDDDQIKEESTKALEQIWDSRAPRISVHTSFSFFLTTALPQLAAARGEGEVVKLLAHPGGRPLSVLDEPRMTSSFQIVAIGPERGWSPKEVSLLTEHGFQLVGLGERVVRVELALVLLLGQLQLLRGGR